MIKRYIYYGLVLLLFVGYGCEKTPVEVETEKVNIYGRDYPIGLAVLWQNNPRMIFTQVPYSFVDSYTDENGNPITETIEGLTCLDDINILGNYMFSLYETSFSYIEDVNLVNGSGAVVTIHLTSPSEELVEGEYTYSTLFSGNTFYAYTSSNYSSIKSSNVISQVIEGKVTVKKSGSGFAVDYELVNSQGGVVKGSYNDKIEELRVNLQTEALNSDIRISGIAESVFIETYMYGNPYNQEYTTDNYNTGFFSTTTGGTSKVTDGAREKVDMALYYNAVDNTLTFTSPIEMRKYTGRTEEYPNHTLYVRAPSTFTEDDYNNIQVTDIPSYFNNSTNTPVVFSVDNFEPGYVFFKSGQGLMGVMNVKSVAEGRHIENDIFAIYGLPGYLVQHYQLSPNLLVDIKSPGNFSSPQIQ